MDEPQELAETPETTEEEPGTPEETPPQEPVKTIWRYAQINLETMKCVSVSNLSDEVIKDYMIPLDDDTDVKAGDTWDAENGVWIPFVPPAPEPPGPTLREQLASLQLKNEALEAQLAQTNADLAAVLEMILTPQ